MAPQLLDIDGDSIHHIHNAAKAFCKPFGNTVEGLLNDIYIDFKWSSDMKARMGDICVILGLKPTVPERYVPHRWLSILDVSLDTLRLFDVYILFYYSFLSVKYIPIYLEVMQEVIDRCAVSAEGKKTIVEMQRSLRKKYSSFSKDRKQRILHKMFFTRARTELLLNLYSHVLPDQGICSVFPKEGTMYAFTAQQTARAV